MKADDALNDLNVNDSIGGSTCVFTLKILSSRLTGVITLAVISSGSIDLNVKDAIGGST